MKDPSEDSQRQLMVDRKDSRTWVSGSDVPLDATIATLSDKLLGLALVHHRFVFKLPKEWWFNSYTQRYESCTAVATSCKKINGKFYVDCSITNPEPSKRNAHVLQFAVGSCKGKEKWNIL